jgi:hypothetical protein
MLGMVVHTFIPAFRRWKQEDHKFEASMGYRVSPASKHQKRKAKVSIPYSKEILQCKIILFILRWLYLNFNRHSNNFNI